VDSVLLEQTQMQAITGASESLTIIPSMDGRLPVDIDQLAQLAPFARIASRQDARASFRSAFTSGAEQG
jgi:hypothetical protein